MQHHHRVARLAPSPRTERFGMVLADLAEGMRHNARRLRRSVTDLSPSERQFLNDVSRPDEIRYPMTPLVHLTAIAARSPLVHHQHGPAELVRALVMKQRVAPALSLVASLDQEDQDNAAFDTAVRCFERSPSAETRRTAIEAGERQLASTRASLDALYAYRCGREVH